MLEVLKITRKIWSTSNINWFIYYCKQLPLVGKAFRNVGYLSMKTKNGLSLAFTILSMLLAFLKKALSAAFLLLLPMLFILKSELTFGERGFATQAFLHIYFILYFLLSGLVNCYTLETSRKKFICVKLMHMDASACCVSGFFFARLWNIVASLPTIIGISLLFGMSWQQGLILCVLSHMLGFMEESIHLFYFKKYHKLLIKNMGFQCLVILLALVAAYGPLIVRKVLPMEGILFHPLFILAVLLSGILSAIYIYRFPLYQEGVNAANQLTDLVKLDSKQIRRNSNFADVKLKEGTFSEEELRKDAYRNRHGYEYLNSLFFARHKRLLLRPVVITSAIILLLFLAGLVGIYQFDLFAKATGKGILKLYPVLIFVMYILSNVVQKATRAMFYNCDISLLHYGFYKKGDALLRMFRLRLKALLILNLIPAALIGGCILVLTVLSRPELFSNMLMVAVFVAVLSVFFTVHHLFLYYILQPFTSELDMKSPLYSIVNWITYMVCWLSMKINIIPSNFVLIIMVSTILYIIAALCIVYRYATRTFIVK